MSGDDLPRWSGAAVEGTGTAGPGETGTEDGARGASWTFWLLCAAAAVPSALLVALLVQAVPAGAPWPPGLPAAVTDDIPLTFADRWAEVVDRVDLSPHCLAAALAALLPAAAVAAGRPGWLLPPGTLPRACAAALAAATGAVSAVVLGLLVWRHVRDATPWEAAAAGTDGGVGGVTWPAEAGLHVVAVLLAVLAVGVALDRSAPRPASGPAAGTTAPG